MKGKLWWTFEDTKDLVDWATGKEIEIVHVQRQKKFLGRGYLLHVTFEVDKARAQEILGLAAPPDEEEWE
jgi:hypothetical protein